MKVNGVVVPGFVPWRHLRRSVHPPEFYEEMKGLPGFDAKELSMEAIVWRLFHEEDEIRVRPASNLSKGCRCSIEHYERVIKRFPDEDRAAMRNAAGKIIVDCEFCAKAFELSI